MTNKKIELFKIQSEELIANLEAAKMSQYGHLLPYGCGNDRNTCKAALKDQIKILRRTLLDIEGGLK